VHINPQERFPAPSTRDAAAAGFRPEFALWQKVNGLLAEQLPQTRSGEW
jgi:hypothetical protein